MKVSFNKDYLTFKYFVDDVNYEEDLLTGLRLEKMMESEEWKLLIAEWLKADILYKEAIMKVGMTERTDNKIAKRCAAYNGFSEAVNFAKKYVDACKKYREDGLKKSDEILRMKAGVELAIPSYD